MKATSQGFERLLTTDEPSEIVTLDKAIEAETANLQILGDRVRALKEEVRKATFSDREQQRKKAIEKIAAKLKKRETLAAELQATIERVGAHTSKPHLLDIYLVSGTTLKCDECGNPTERCEKCGFVMGTLKRERLEDARRVRSVRLPRRRPRRCRRRQRQFSRVDQRQRGKSKS